MDGSVWEMLTTAHLVNADGSPFCGLVVPEGYAFAVSRSWSGCKCGACLDRVRELVECRSGNCGE